MKKIFGILILLFLFFPTLVHAQTISIPTITPYSFEGWYISSFNDDIHIQNDGSVKVVETIIVDFKDLEKHGIIRDIPIIYKNSDGSEIYTELDINNVSQDGEKAKFEKYRNGDFLELKIGDPDKTINGTHTYVIDYTARGVLRSFADYDEFYWNITGNDWPVPILSSQANITLPKDGVVKFTCFEGSLGTTGADCITKKVDEKTIQVKGSGAFETGEGLTAVLGYKKGMVPILLIEKPKTLFEKFISPPSLITLGISIVIGISLVIFLWSKKGRDYWFKKSPLLDKNTKGQIKPFGGHEQIVVEYTPPQNLRPAEIGVLVDEKADTLDVTSTIIDLASRGFLTIREIPKKWMFGKVDYELQKKAKSKDNLIGYEKELLDRLFDEKDKVTISSLKKTFYSDLAKVKGQLYRDVQKKELFFESPEKTRGKYLAIAIVLIVVGFVLIGPTIGTGIVFGLDIVIAFIVTGVFMLIFSFKMPRRTAQGRELLRRIKGYQLFISTAEKHKQRFLEDKNLFNEVLPYAIVFGLTEKFAKAMKDAGIKPPSPSWYSGTHAFNAPLFASNVSDFSNSFSSAIASTPSRSGGFSSGGSSGGGFGGGGGGSW